MIVFFHSSTLSLFHFSSTLLQELQGCELQRLMHCPAVLGDLKPVQPVNVQEEGQDLEDLAEDVDDMGQNLWFFHMGVS